MGTNPLDHNVFQKLSNWLPKWRLFAWESNWTIWSRWAFKCKWLLAPSALVCMGRQRCCMHDLPDEAANCSHLPILRKGDSFLIAIWVSKQSRTRARSAASSWVAWQSEKSKFTPRKKGSTQWSEEVARSFSRNKAAFRARDVVTVLAFRKVA